MLSTTDAFETAKQHFLKGLSALEREDYATARADFEQSLHYLPDRVSTLTNLNACLVQLHDFDAAYALSQRILSLEPTSAETYLNLGKVHQARGDEAAALAAYEQAATLAPQMAEAHYNQGVLHLECNRPETALACLDRALARRPDYADALTNRGVALHKLRQMEAAIESYQRALALRPEHADTLTNTGLAFSDMGRLDAAIANYQQALAVLPQPSNASAQSGPAQVRFNLSLALLVKGDLQQGWPLYEARWQVPDFPSEQRHFTQTLWLGQSPLAGRTILLHAEQGLGDTIQFCRYVPLVKALGARVVLEVQRALLPLLATLEGVDVLMAKGQPLPAFDFHTPLLSLPLAFQTQLSTLPTPARYLSSEPSRRKAWTTALGPRQRPRVGLVWSGNPGHKNDHQRSIPLATLAGTLPPGMDYYGLQKDLRTSDEDALKYHPEIQHLGPQIRDFADTAALCELMDVVVSVDTSVAHLSAALGRPTWVLLPFAPDWRWLLERNDSPWYPTMRLYRQSTARTWDEVLHRVAKDLPALSESRPPTQ
jgi:tetratricopeptide (TPR) repeat protein